MKSWIRKIGDDLLNLFYPRLCLLCEAALVEGEQQLCSRCLCGLAYTHYPDVKDNPVAHLLMGKEKVVAASAYLRFEQGGKVQRLIHALKYYGNKKLAFLLGRQAALDLLASGAFFAEVEVLVPVPLHARKLRRRGYNQSEWIARGIASVLDVPVCTTAVRRVVMTESQTGKVGYSRWDNLESAFSLADPEPISGRHLLLVDDVITSGATAAACIDALSDAEGVKISFFPLAVTQA